MKSGNAVSVQLDDDVQIVVIMASPAGRLVKASDPDVRHAHQGKADPHAGAEQKEENEEKDPGLEPDVVAAGCIEKDPCAGRHRQAYGKRGDAPRKIGTG